jgi:ComF family protein
MSGGTIENTSTGKFNLLQWFLDCLFPKECLICKHEGGYFCQSCQAKTLFTYPLICFGCSKINVSSGICQDCQPRYAFDGIIIAADYEDEVIGALIRMYKYRFVKSLAYDLSNILNKKLEVFIQQSQLGYVIEHDFFSAVVLGVPLSQRRERWREFNQAQLLAMQVAEYCNLEFRNDILQREHRPAQAKLNSSERLHNLIDSFQATTTSPSLIILVDDVVTTGATLHEAAKALKKAGALEVWGLVVAKG